MNGKPRIKHHWKTRTVEVPPYGVFPCECKWWRRLYCLLKGT